MITTRRSLITGLASLLCAPAIVRASSLMPVKAWPETAVVLQTNSAAADPTAWVIVRAGERIGRGELVEFRDGLAYRAQLGSNIVGRALGSSLLDII